MKNKKRIIIIGVVVLIVTVIAIAVSSSSEQKSQNDGLLISSTNSSVETKTEAQDVDDNVQKYIMYDDIKKFAVLDYPSRNEEWCYNVYSDNTGTYKSKFVELTECNIDKKVTSISIPDKIDGYPVICMGDRLLENYDKLENLIIPNTIIKIGNRACNGCRSLSNINIPNSVTVIGDLAFHNHGFCAMGELIIPEGVVEIGECAFSTYIGREGYEDQDVGFTKVVLPKSLKKIHYAAFYAQEVVVLNPNLEFVTLEGPVFYHNEVVYGYSGSTAAKYCAETGTTFKIIE